MSRNSFLRPNKLLFCVQSGSPAFLKKQDISKAFSDFGKIKYLYYETGLSFGFVQFHSAIACTQAENLLLPIITHSFQWEIHTFRDLRTEDSTEMVYPHQILLESRDLPVSWERFIIIKEFFKKFGEVTGMIHLGYDNGSVQRIVVSFKESKVAQDLLGSCQKILHGFIEVKPVTLQTLGERRSVMMQFG